MINAPAEPRCPRCDGVLVHAGAICVICDDQGHYEAPIRTAPPLRMTDSPELPERTERFTRTRDAS
jgi:hypothetical protein